MILSPVVIYIQTLLSITKKKKTTKQIGTRLQQMVCWVDVMQI